MALNQLNITSESSANSWKQEAQRLNDETYQLLQDVGNALIEVQRDADSTIVDEIVHYGNNILEGTNKILEDMNGLVSMVGSILKKINSVLDAGRGVVKGIVEAIAEY